MGLEAAWIIFSVTNSAPYNVSGGDLNGDGYSDLVAGSPFVDVSFSNAGRVEIFLGGPDGPSLVADEVIDGQTTSYEFGSHTRVLGDINGDGYADFAASEEYTGDVAFYLGGPSGVVFDTEIAGLFDEGVLAAPGDVNGDGLDDAVLCDPFENTSASFAYDLGSCQLHLGSFGGITTSPWASWEGEDNDTFLGISAGGGDFDGDGFADVVMGKESSLGGNDTFVLAYGGPAAMGAAVTGDDVDAAALAGCDVNGDGFDDLLLGSFSDVYLYLGGPTGLSYTGDLFFDATHWDSPHDDSWRVDCAGDVNNDGFEDVVTGDGDEVRLYKGGVDGLSDARVSIYEGSDGEGEFVAGVGDVDGDGYPDFAAISGDSGARDIYIFRGGPDADADGLPPGEDCDDDDPSLPADLFFDTDGDGFGEAPAGFGCPSPGIVVLGTDCNDADDTIGPGGTEVPHDGVDQDCDGTELCYRDLDYDGARNDVLSPSYDLDCTNGPASLPIDCDDTDAAVHPGAPEVVGNGQDEDCDGLELCFVDLDGDGFPGDVSAEGPLACDAPGLFDDRADADCDDTDDGVFPGGNEAPGDGIDGDCDGRDLCFRDRDFDGYPSEDIDLAPLGCDLEGASLAGPTDCDDADPSVHPEQDEVPGNHVDNDCDGVEWCYVDGDLDGHRSEETLASDDLDCWSPGEGTAEDPLDCDDQDPAVGSDCSDPTTTAGDTGTTGTTGTTDAAKAEGCGCASGGVGGAWVGLLALAVGRRRAG